MAKATNGGGEKKWWLCGIQNVRGGGLNDKKFMTITGNA
jgi:hypothetical protein